MNEYTICVNCGSGLPNVTQDKCPFCGLSITKKSNIISKIIDNTKNELFGYPIETNIEWCASSDNIKYMLVPHTCEHCKFYIFIAKEYDGNCGNKIVEEKVHALCQEDDTQFNKNFGCIFWESK